MTGVQTCALPISAGRWIDYWDGAEFNGSTTLNGYAAPLEKLPLFVRAGAIIPMGPDTLYDGEQPMDPITLDLYPSGTSTFTLGTCEMTRPALGLPNGTSW